VDRLAKQRGLSKQGRRQTCGDGELKRMENTIPLRDSFAALRDAHKLPPSAGAADKAFFDELSGDP